MNVVYALDGVVRPVTEGITLGFLHAVHIRFPDSGPSPTDEVPEQGGKNQEA